MSEWPKEHDWKSCNGQKPFEGSNPSLSAKKAPRVAGRLSFGKDLAQGIPDEKTFGTCAAVQLGFTTGAMMPQGAQRWKNSPRRVLGMTRMGWRQAGQGSP